MRGRPLSLKARAIGYLSRREHSRWELKRKLTPHAESDDQVEALLTELVKLEYLSDDRFIESVVHRRGAKFGNLRLRQELADHKLDKEKVSAALQEAKATELDRARAAWSRRFSAKPTSLEDKAKQIRFLAARGFGGEVIRRVLGADLDDL